VGALRPGGNTGQGHVAARRGRTVLRLLQHGHVSLHTADCLSRQPFDILMQSPRSKQADMLLLSCPKGGDLACALPLRRQRLLTARKHDELKQGLKLARVHASSSGMYCVASPTGRMEHFSAA